MTDRREWIGAAASGLLAVPWFAAAQSAGRVYRVGILRPGLQPLAPDDLQAVGIRNGLRELGYVEGRNLLLDQRYAGGDADRVAALARELVQAKMDVIVAVGTLAAQATKAVTSTVPVVVLGNFDPVALKVVPNLARPGGNVTGVLIAPDGTLAGKRVELLMQAVPRARRVALLIPDDSSVRLQVKETQQAASTLGLRLSVVEVRGGDYARAFASIAADRAEALVVGSHQYFVRDRAQIIELAARQALPAMYEWREQVADGGLMTYSTSLQQTNQRVASYVDRILKGARPGDLPLERPNKFQLVINLKTAKALGLMIPQALLLRADEVIE